MIPILRLLCAAAGSDRDLLDRYARARDDEAFEALVRRYGPGVWAACVRLAGRDAEDAFQAVLLVLARKAGSVTGSLPAWLHAVTRRVASNLRRNARRRGEVEAAARRPAHVPPDDVTLREGLARLDEELARLPERYRAVLLVCCLDGRSRDEAAVQLGWSEGQVKGRLERAREVLRARLADRGVELGGVLLAAAVTGPVPARAAAPSAAAITLSHGVTRAMLIQKFRLAVAVLATGAAVAGGVMLRAQPGDPAPPPGNASGQPGVAQDKGRSPAAERVDETTRKEIDDLRKRADDLERKMVPPAPGRQKVVIASPVVKDVVVPRQYVGKVVAHHHVTVTALASGTLVEIPVREGQAVKKGDVLFRVDPTLAKAKREAEMAEVQIAKIEYDNAKNLFNQKVVSSKEVALHEARLAKAKAKADLADAELAFTAGRAGFDGLVGRVQHQAGGVVKVGDAVTTLRDDGVMWVYFNVPEARYLEFKAGRDPVKEMPVELVLANGRAFPEAGRLAAIEGQFDPDTGTVPFRADFPNPKGLLRHGQSGTVVIRESLKGAVVVPQRATYEDRGKRYAYVVGKDDVAHRREVVVRAELDDSFVVAGGVGASDRIVVEGVNRVRDGEKVEYEPRPPGEGIGSPRGPGEQ
jgi:membrane fusion protein (multidrug efflux system)